MRHRLKQAISELPHVQIMETDTIGNTIAGIQENMPDILVLDIRMPGGSGIDVLKTLGEDTRPSVVIVFTNFSYPQYRKTCLTFGADYFFDKATDLDNLTAVIQNRAEQVVSWG